MNDKAKQFVKLGDGLYEDPDNPDYLFVVLSELLVSKSIADTLDNRVVAQLAIEAQLAGTDVTPIFVKEDDVPLSDEHELLVQQAIEELAAPQEDEPIRCPVCTSTSVMSATDKTWECGNCGHQWLKERENESLGEDPDTSDNAG